MDKYFLAFPFSQFCAGDSDILTTEAKVFFEDLTNLFKEKGIEYYSAHEREKWGSTYHSDMESTKIDYDSLKECNKFICMPGIPYSGGVHIELGWATVLNKKIYLLLEKGKEYSPLVTGIESIVDVQIFYYEDFYTEIIPLIKKILDM